MPRTSLSNTARARPPPGSYKHFQTFLDHLLFPSDHVGTKSAPSHPLYRVEPYRRRFDGRGHWHTILITDIRATVIRALADAEADFSVMDCDPELADTAQFCEHYGIPPNQSANAIVLASKRPSGVHAMFLVLATTRLDVNGLGRQLMGVKKVSFASSDVTSTVTGMVVGGVTPFGRPHDLALFVDAAVMKPEWVVVGGGSRDVKIKVNPEVFPRLKGTSIIRGLAT